MKPGPTTEVEVAASPLPLPVPLPDHTQLPDTDGIPVESWQEHPQGILLTTSVRPHLLTLHPDGQFGIGQDSGIYWRNTDPPLRGCRAPDWYYVRGVDPMWLKGKRRRSYVLWHEKIAPTLVLEFASGDGSEERDRTPEEGKFWVYEQAIRASYYGIYEVDRPSVEVFRLVDGRYELAPANARGHVEIPEMGIELGIWRGTYQGVALPWLRFWDDRGRLLPASDERADAEEKIARVAVQTAKDERKKAQDERRKAQGERQRAEEQRQQAEEQRQRAEEQRLRADRLAAKLRELGIDPDEGGRA